MNLERISIYVTILSKDKNQKFTDPSNRKIVSKNRIFDWFSAPQNMTEADEDTTQIVSPLLAALYCVNIIGDACTMEFRIICLIAGLTMGSVYRLFGCIF
jgi:hypothetical protein